jgi:uncharacterized membrane protein YraQ (UPF0718 family)/copper chaperone CopZ
MAGLATRSGPPHIVGMLQAMWHVLLELAPWLLLGSIVAGLLHVALPRDFVRRQLDGRWAVLKAVALGVPLPLCSCGVIPAGLGLRKDGASNGATVGFLISTPQTGVDSILVSASFLGWPFALFKVLSAAVTGIVGGYAADAVAPPRAAPLAPAAPTIEPGGPRGLRAFLSHSLEILETIWHWLVFGVVASAAIQTFLPPGMLATLGGHGGLLAMLAMLVISLPMYVCATASVPIAAALVAGGLPPGAALVFLMAGPATNVATIGAIYRTLGVRSLVVYLATIIGGSIGLGMTFDFVLQTSAVSAAQHHHEASWWAIASAIVLLALIIWFAWSSLTAFVRRHRHRATTDVIELSVEGMTCNSCVARLERTLTRDENVESARVELEPGRALISGKVSEAHVLELVERAGFTARRRST